MVSGEQLAGAREAVERWLPVAEHIIERNPANPYGMVYDSSWAMDRAMTIVLGDLGGDLGTTPESWAEGLRSVGVPDDLAGSASELRSTYMDVINFKTELSLDAAKEYVHTVERWGARFGQWLGT